MYRLGVDLGGTNIAVGVVDENYNIICEKSVKTACPRPAEQIVSDIAACVLDTLKAAGTDNSQIACAGIGVPGALDREKGTVVFSNNLGFYDVKMVSMLKELTGLDFYIENDANAAAVGEYIAGSGKGCENFITVTIGTGIGSGIIIGGRLYTGRNGAGGELGHTVIYEGGIECNCGRRGCFERYASATALIEQTKAAMLEDKQSLMWQICEGDITKAGGRTAYRAMREGDKTAAAVVNGFVTHLATGIVNIVNAFQPDIISIGGGVSGEGEALTEPIKAILKKENYARYCAFSAEIKIATLGNKAGIIGAAFLDKVR